MALTNQEIADHVGMIVAGMRKDAPAKDHTLIDAGAALVINLLQNLNEIAYQARVGS
jgi:hypothetical protein